ncbi:MAG: ABC transporter ATP-binding protein [Bifidobacteriaceae bacterium]|jgi:iron complex transport system ATP-binding protein|nr:ABC transporter ATP-binding protein [Bifidobacteriaceae bacterium]
MNEVLRLEDVRLTRGPKTILDGIDWSVREGQHWVMLGPNGAGKTTVLQIAATRLFPTSGRARVLGQRLGRVDVFELRGRVGFASAALAGRIPPGEKVSDAVVTGAYGITGRWREAYEAGDERRASDLMAAFDVLDLAERTFGTLSEGERKRVQIARALMADPEVLLLDEPSAGLDLGGREQLVAALAELASDPRSPVMILVTHHLEEIPPGFTHAALMAKGRITAAGEMAATLTDENLTEAFDMPLRVTTAGRRWGAVANR